MTIQVSEDFFPHIMQISVQEYYGYCCNPLLLINANVTKTHCTGFHIYTMKYITVIMPSILTPC